MKGLLKFVLGVGLPILLIGMLFASLGNYRFSDPPPPVALHTDPPEGDAAVSLVGSPDGSWTLTEGSFVGYRVVEHYPNRTATGVGRTTQVDAEMTVVDSIVTDVEVRADLRELTSDRQNRDRATRGHRYLNAEEYPWAIFTLTEPVPLAGVNPGSPFGIQVRGELTVRDITRPVTVGLQGRWDGTRVQLVGTMPVHLPDYEVRVPDIAGFVTVEPDGEVELDLTFERVAR